LLHTCFDFQLLKKQGVFVPLRWARVLSLRGENEVEFSAALGCKKLRIIHKELPMIRWLPVDSERVMIVVIGVYWNFGFFFSSLC
jgi:hypothetical protein